ncbi:MAG: hypothetical protein M1835_005971 [Candelina submexicana]|nr:MAG: hypothetical protein M1835_005971 [Candelina submexicana]
MSNTAGIKRMLAEASHINLAQGSYVHDREPPCNQAAKPNSAQEDQGIVAGAPNSQSPCPSLAQVGHGTIEGPPDLPFQQGPCKIVTTNHEGTDVLALTLSLSMVVGIMNLLRNNDKVSNIEEVCNKVKKDVEAKKFSVAIYAHEITKLKIAAEDPALRQEGEQELDAMDEELSESMINRLLEFEQIKKQLPLPPAENSRRQLERKTDHFNSCKEELTALLRQEERLRTLLESLKAQQKGSLDRFQERLGELFKEANLLEEERQENDPPITLPPLAETQAAVAQVTNPVPETPSEAPSMERLYGLAIFEDFRTNWQKYKEAMYEFQRHKENYSEYFQDFERDRVLGRHHCTSDTFAQIYVQDGRDATRALINAEGQYKEVEARARALGVLQNDAEQAFDFIDRSDDGYGEGFNAYLSSTVNRPWVESWLQETIDCDNLDLYVKGSQVREIDDWEWKPLEAWDSYSQVADGRWRQEIDRLRSREQRRYNLRRRRESVDYQERGPIRKRQRLT